MDNIIERFRASLNEILLLRGMDTVGFGRDFGIDPSVVRRWRNNGIDVRLKTLIKLADYFECSIDYLCGKTHEYKVFKSQKEYPHFGERLLSVMAQSGIKLFQLLNDTKIIPSKYYYWLGGGEPSLSSLEVLAEYFNVTLDYLVGRYNLN